MAQRPIQDMHKPLSICKNGLKRPIPDMHNQLSIPKCGLKRQIQDMHSPFSIDKTRRLDNQNHCSANEARHPLWTKETLGSLLVNFSMPQWWISLCLDVAAGLHDLSSLVCVEVFAGVAAVSGTMYI